MPEYNNYQDNGALGWDDEIIEESSFIILPAGDYSFTVKKFEKGRHSGSEKIPPCNKAIVTFTVKSPDGRSVDIQENYLLHRKMEWKLSEFFAAVGMKSENERIRMQWSPELIGKQGMCKIIVHEYVKNGESRQINRIESLYPSYSQPNAQQPAQTRSWGQGGF